MGGNSSSRHVSLDSDEEVTFVKGIRLSEKVIDRMKVSPPVVRPQAPTRSFMQSPTTPPVESSVPDERHVPIIPHSPSYASALVPPPLSEPITPLMPPVSEETSTPPSSEGLPIATGNEHVVVPDPQPGCANILVPDPQPAEPINAPSRVSSEPITAPPLVEPTCAPVELLTPPPVMTSTTEPVTIPPSPTTDPLTEPVTPSVEPIEPVETPSSSTSTSADPMDLPVPSPVELETSSFPISIPDPVPSVMEESPVSPSGSASDEMLSKTQMGPSSTEEPLVPRLPPVEEPVVPSSIHPVEVFPPQTHVVNEEKLREQIREDLQKLLDEEMKMAERNMRQQLEEETAKAKAQAQAAVRLQIQEEVQKVLEEKKASYQQTLADAIRREQLNLQDEHLITQYYAQKLDEKEKDLQNQEALFQEQIVKMQEKTAQLTKVTAENHRKGLEDATNRFRRYQIKPVCLDLQSQIMKCYAENKGQTMSCSNIASLYIQCVDRAKQDKKLSTGG